MRNHTGPGGVHGDQADPSRFARSWKVRCGGNVVGPVSIDQMERGLAAGKIPALAEMAHVERDGWRRVGEVLGAGCEPASEPLAAPAPMLPPPPSYRYLDEPVSIPRQGLLASIFG